MPVRDLLSADRLRDVCADRIGGAEQLDAEAPLMVSAESPPADVNSGRVWKSSSPYRRIATPGLVRPARPERCCADACDTGSIGRRWNFARAL